MALRFAQQGARVLATSRGSGVGSLAADSNGRIVALRCESDTTQVAALADECRKRFGRLDILCNNAGIGGKSQTRIHELELEDWDRVLDTNLRGAFLVLKHTLPLMLKAGGGSIVNMASIGSFPASPGSSAYITSKGALLMLTRTAALEYTSRTTSA